MGGCPPNGAQYLESGGSVRAAPSLRREQEGLGGDTDTLTNVSMLPLLT